MCAGISFSLTAFASALSHVTVPDDRADTSSRFGLAQGCRSPNDMVQRPALLFLPIAYGSIQVVFRAGTNPTGMLAISFMDLISTTETLFDCSFAT
jgi:hypothetical protein